jgi:hypothetical protein
MKYVATTGDLDAATQLKVAKETISVVHNGAVVERHHSQNPAPSARFHWGTEWEVKATLEFGDQDDMAVIMGGSNVSEVFTITQTVRQLPNYDVRFAIIRPSDGLLVLKDVTKVNFIPTLEESYQNGELFYLPIMIKSLDTSDYTSDNSAS